MKKIFYLMIRRMFSADKAWKLAFAAAFGILIAILPSFQFKIAALFIVSALFGLNLLCILAGEIVTMIFPVLSILAGWINRVLANFTMRYLNLAYSLNWHPFMRTSMLTNIVSGIAISTIAYFIFYFIFRWMLKKTDKFSGRHVFSDVNGSRWPVMKVIASVFCCAAVAVLSMAAVSINENPALPKYRYNFTNSISNLATLPKAFSIGVSTLRDRLYLLQNRSKRTPSNSKVLCNKQVYAFYVGYDQNSYQSLKENLGAITTVVPNWYTLNKKSELAKASDAGIMVSTEAVDGYIAHAHKREEPLINNYDGKTWNQSILHNLVANCTKYHAFIHAALSDALTNHYSGINIDFENLDARDQKNYLIFLHRLYTAFHKSKLHVSIDVPASNDAYNDRSISAFCDNLIIMAYDEHSSEDAPGSIASSPWLAKVLSGLSVNNKKVIVGLGNYGYDWVVGSSEPAQALTFEDVMSTCSGYGLKVHWDKTTQNPYLTYKDAGDDHVIWFLDSATFYNQVQQSINFGVGGVALWRLGSEDYTIWKTLKNIKNLSTSSAIRSISTVTSDLSISNTGTGDLMNVSQTEQKGRRAYQVDRLGYITDERYLSYPSSYTVRNFGGTEKKEVALSFDDGPDPYYTSKVLDILEKYHVNASFFVIGENAENSPELVQREYHDGDDIGNHTFTHPNIAKISFDRTRLELNATQRLIEEITGHSTILFRAPYNADSLPDTLDELVPVLRAQQLGYLMVGESIDPFDWQSPKAEAIVSSVMAQLGHGNIILLHDGGGLRDNTISALPELIQKIKSKGYTFVTINQLMNKSRDAVMPAVKSNDIYIPYDQEFFRFVYSWHNVVELIFYITICLGTGRLLFLAILSSRQKRRYRKQEIDRNYDPFVSVIIPCYNEEKVILRTVESVLNSDYEQFEVLVIDDGSTDDSYKLICAQFQNDPRVTCIRKENGGKSRALNCGLRIARGEIFIAIDADTVFDKDAIRLMTGYFKDADVVAVSGNVKVGNRKKLLTQWQHCEYVTGFNLERRAYSVLNCITVVPGAIGAWRKNTVLKHGGFRSDTLAEDTDMTLALLEEGGRIEFEENAKAYTESPETFKSLLKQRFRWTYGTLQCLWKHKTALFNTRQKSLGFIAMPFMWIFQYVFQTFCPIVDLYLIITLFSGPPSLKIIIWYLAFLSIDWVSSIFAFRLERENPLPLLWMPIQRLVYRFMMAYIVLKSIYTAMRGTTVGWNKLQRTGSVTNEHDSQGRPVSEQKTIHSEDGEPATL